MIRVFIGYDGAETVAYHVLSHSILSRASMPVSVAPLMLSQLKDSFTRERNALQSTEFAFSRFLVPYLSGYEGWSIFMDCDMLVLDDMKNLWDLRDDKYAVMCVKHDYTPKTGEKFLGQVQTTYEKKNWSSVILFNNAKCKALTPDYVNKATGLELHRFRWLGDDNLIGEIPLKWNFLVGEYDKIPAEQISNLHYTLGGPYFSSYKDVDYADLWFAERDRLLHAAKDVRLVNPAQSKTSQPTAEDLFRRALAAFESGQKADAKKFAKDVLAIDGNHADALNLLGVIHHQDKSLKEAQQWFEKAAKAAPDNPHFMLNLAMVYEARGDIEATKRTLDTTLAIRPGYVQAFQKRLQIAIAEGDYATGERVLKDILPVLPSSPQILTILITMLGKQEKHSETLPYFDQLFALGADVPAGLVADYGLTLQVNNRVHEAIAQFEKALLGGHETPELHYNMSIAYDHVGELEKAHAAICRALELKPDYEVAKSGFALLEIKLKEASDGYAFYRDRFPAQDKPKRIYPIKEWRGESLAGKRLLLWSEQGIGDIIMFTGLIPYLQKQGATLGMEMDGYMMPLMQRSFPQIEMFEMEEKSAKHIIQKGWDYHCALGDLMELCLPHYEPRSVRGHLKADPQRVAQFKAKYQAIKPGFRVGISWKTISEKTGYIRNIPFMQWMPLLQTPNCHFISLQYMGMEEAVQNAIPMLKANNIPMTIDPEVDAIHDKDQWAAQTAAMDMVISIQNSTVHMAGALGVDTLILLSKSADWRWGKTQLQSPFYQSVEILRQAEFGNWKPVLDAAQQKLSSRLLLAKAS